MRESSVKSKNIISKKLVALKSLALSLSNISPEFLIDQNRFLTDLIYLFTIFENMFFNSCKTRG